MNAKLSPRRGGGKGDYTVLPATIGGLSVRASLAPVFWPGVLGWCSGPVIWAC